MKRNHARKVISDDRGSQQALVAAMMRPEFYPKPPGEVTHKETHISHIFLAGESVYKVKKPVRLPFLDFSTLAKRRHFLQEEMRLNRRLAPSVYLGVMPIGFDDGGWRLGGWSEPAEYTLVMRRLPEKRMLDFLLETQQVTVSMMKQLADHLAAFHAGAKPLRETPPDVHWSTVRNEWTENFTELSALLETVFDRRELELIRSYGDEFLTEARDLFGRRAAEGWIREVHGDLHAEHICFAPEGIQIFDCIEFSAELRCCDLASEIAFLLMDVSVRGGESLVSPLMNRYLERLNDREMFRLLPFYQCYRALVRAKVHALRLGKWNAAAARYLSYARRMTWERFKPFLLLVCGLTGSGKSTLARELGARLGMTVINSDIVRKAMARNAGRDIVPLNQGLYSPAMTGKTYRKLEREAEKQMLWGHGVILDATFIHAARRKSVIRLAEKHGVPIFLIRCFASDELTRRRLAARTAEGKDVSDGRWEVYVAQKAAYEPLDEISSTQRLDLDTRLPVEELVQSVEDFLRTRFEQKR
ncbi:MAG TPA: AAA family ATPase [Candidatus Binatia bacterium]|nr:AAA family ATPase [Candidatus Binatia bacterium]